MLRFPITTSLIWIYNELKMEKDLEVQFRKAEGAEDEERKTHRAVFQSLLHGMMRPFQGIRQRHGGKEEK